MSETMTTVEAIASIADLCAKLAERPPKGEGR